MIRFLIDFKVAEMIPTIQIVVPADEPALFYHSVAHAEINLEPYDVEAGVYKIAYGNKGEVYSVEVRDHSVRLLRKDLNLCPKELVSVLEKFLKSVGKKHSESSLEKLLILCAPYLEK